MGRMRGEWERPDGLRYHPEILHADEERATLTTLSALRMDEVRMRERTARRTVRHFGYGYDYETWGLTGTEPWPEALGWLRTRCADLAGLPAERLAQALVTHYPPGAVIGWHRDAPVFGPTVVGVSLAAACLLRFQRGSGPQRRVYEQPLEPRSAYVLGGAARSAWQHSIPPVTGTRWSVTFRTLRRESPRAA